MYNPKEHLKKEWQVIGCGTLTATALVGGLLMPAKSGEIPVFRLLAFVASGTALATGAAIDKSKKLLDLQKMVIDREHKKLFVQSQALTTAITIEDKHLEAEKLVAQKVGGSDV